MAHARGERAQAAVGARVRIGADDEVAGAHDALLGQQRVLDAHAADLEVVRDALLAGEVARYLGLLGALDVLVRRVVVGHEADAVRVEHVLASQLAERLDGDGRGDVVRQHEVQVALDELARLHLVQMRVGRQDLLGHRHGSCHGVALLSVSGAGPAKNA